MNRLSYVLFYLIGFAACTSDQNRNQIKNYLIDVAFASERFVDSLKERGIKEIILYRVDCENCKVALPAYVIWKNERREFIEKIQTNGQRVRVSSKAFIFSYLRLMEESLLNESITETRDTTIINFKETRNEILKIFIDRRVITFPSCELCLNDKHKSHHVFRDFITTRLFRDEIGGLFLR